MDKQFALYGCGKAGLSVALALKAGGWKVAGCDSRTEKSRQLGAQWLACPAIKIPDGLPPGVPLMIGVPEGALGETDHKIGGDDPYIAGRVIFHLSGALPSRILNFCRLSGAKVGSLHPLMILPDPLTGARNLKSATFAIEGRDEAVAVLKEMALSISGKLFILSVKGKTLYHIAAVLASNYIISLLTESEQLLERAGVPEEESLKAFQSLVEATVKNFYSEGPVQALTGPVERGELQMVGAHLRALSKLPRSKTLYKTMTLKTIEIARRKHPGRAEIYDELEKLVQ
jgi:predicted short-subunit dehydrogenase-like oxidoreductase (DUF2520 family)